MPKSPVTPLAAPLADAEDEPLEPDEQAPSRLPLLVIAILALIALGGTVDLILDKPATFLSLHVLFELSMVLFSLSTIVVLSLQWRRTSTELHGARRTLEATQRSLAARQVERDAWRRSAEDALAGQHQVVQEEGGQLGATGEPGLLIDGDGVLPHRPLAAPGRSGDLLVAVALQEQQGHLTLGWGESPGGELPIDGHPEPGERGKGP